MTGVALMGMSSAALAQETNRHPLTGLTSYDHYPHFNSSYHYGSKDRIDMQSAVSMQRYGRNKGRVFGTVVGAIAGGLIDKRGDSSKGMVLGGIAGGIIGQTVASEPRSYGSYMVRPLNGSAYEPKAVSIVTFNPKNVESWLAIKKKNSADKK